MITFAFYQAYVTSQFRFQLWSCVISICPRANFLVSSVRPKTRRDGGPSLSGSQRRVIKLLTPQLTSQNHTRFFSPKLNFTNTFRESELLRNDLNLWEPALLSLRAVQSFYLLYFEGWTLRAPLTPTLQKSHYYYRAFVYNDPRKPPWTLFHLVSSTNRLISRTLRLEDAMRTRPEK